jgi:hypothetical protein
MKKYQYYDSKLVGHYFDLYKANPTEEGLALLYMALDPIILSVLQRMSKNFRHKHPDDFEDITQCVKMDVYKILEKLTSISETGNQVLSISIKASMWSFKTNYRSLKKQQCLSFEYMSEELLDRIAIADSVEYVRGQPDALFSTNSADLAFLALVSTSPSQYAYSFLKSLPADLTTQALAINRYKDKAPVLKFCIDCFLEGRVPSTMLISKRWGISNANFWIKYSLILMKLSILSVYKGVHNEKRA